METNKFNIMDKCKEVQHKVGIYVQKRINEYIKAKDLSYSEWSRNAYIHCNVDGGMDIYYKNNKTKEADFVCGWSYGNINIDELNNDTYKASLEIKFY